MLKFIIIIKFNTCIGGIKYKFLRGNNRRISLYRLCKNTNPFDSETKKSPVSKKETDDLKNDIY